jgi:hypothetical protein
MERLDKLRTENLLGKRTGISRSMMSRRRRFPIGLSAKTRIASQVPAVPIRIRFAPALLDFCGCQVISLLGFPQHFTPFVSGQSERHDRDFDRRASAQRQ